MSTIAERPGVRWANHFMAVGQLVVVLWLLITEDLTPLAVLIFSILGTLSILVAVVKTWPSGPLWLLILGSTVPRFSATLFNLHFRPEHVAIAIIAATLAGKTAIRCDWPALRLYTFDFFLLAYVLLNFVTSLLTSPVPHMTLRWAALNALATAPYFLIRVLVKSEQCLRRALGMLLCAGAAEATYGLISFLSNRFLHTRFGVTYDQYDFMPGTYGTQFEANIFGSYVACCAIMFLVMYFTSQEAKRLRYAIGFGLTTAATVISLARSAMLALGILFPFLLWSIFRGKQLTIKRLAIIAVGGLSLSVALSPIIMDYLQERFSTIDVLNLETDDTTMTRLFAVVGALEDVRAHPLLGSGTDSFQLFFQWKDYMPGKEEEPGWISNLPLRILHDTGVVGLAVFLMFVGSLLIAVRKCMRTLAVSSKQVLTALLWGSFLYAITFQATEATMLAFTWVHLGLLATAVSLHRGHAFSHRDALVHNS